MQFAEPFCHPAIVEMHLPGGYTRVRLFALAHGYAWWEIPTRAIPAFLRPLGSRLFVTTPRFTVEPEDSIEAIRERVQEAVVRPLTDDELHALQHSPFEG